MLGIGRRIHRKDKGGAKGFWIRIRLRARFMPRISAFFSWVSISGVRGELVHDGLVLGYLDSLYRRSAF